MASARQIAANRRNAVKSTGPITQAGKRRVRGNAYRHGFASQAIFTVVDPQVAVLIRAMVGGENCVPVRTWARTAAEGMLELARLRQMRRALMGEVAVEQSIGRLDRPLHLAMANVLGLVFRLQALDRYERRISSRRDRAIRQISKWNAENKDR